MFERFTERARRAVDLAQDEATRLNHDYIGTEHLLLGLIGAGDGVAAKALEPLGIGLGAVQQLARQRALRIAGAGRGEEAPSVEEIIARSRLLPPVTIPVTEWANEALELAIREADVLGLDYVGTEHILLGLVRMRDGAAAQVLEQLGADLNWVRQQVLQQLLGAALARIDSLDRRLAAIEGRVGIPDDLQGSDQKIAQTRSKKQAAITSFEFEAADALREKEKRLLASRAAWEKEWTEPAAGRLSLAGEMDRVNTELKRLQAILRENGIETGSDPA